MKRNLEREREEVRQRIEMERESIRRQMEDLRRQDSLRGHGPREEIDQREHDRFSIFGNAGDNPSIRLGKYVNPGPEALGTEKTPETVKHLEADRRIDSQREGVTFTTIDRTEGSTFDLSHETRKLDEKLSMLQERNRSLLQQSIERGTRYKDIQSRPIQKETVSASREAKEDPKGYEMFKLKAQKFSTPLVKTETTFEQRLDAVRFKEKEAESIRTMLQEREERINRKEEQLISAFGSKEEEIERARTTLKEREDILIRKEEQLERRLKEIDENFEEREWKLSQYELHLIEMQQLMDRRYEGLEKRMTDWEKFAASRTEAPKHNETTQRILEQDKRENTLTTKEIVTREQQPKPIEDEKAKEKEEIDRKIKQLEKQKAQLESAESKTEDKEEETKGNLKDILNIKLNLTPFSGKEPVSKNEASYEEFKIEFESVKPIYSEQVLRQALRKCLKDQARKTMLHLGPRATVSDIIKSLEETFGNIASEDTLMSKFLLAEQYAEESLVEWGLRLEEIMLQVSRKTKMNSQEQNLRLKKRFWRGLRNDELRQATRVHFESPISYEELRNKVRAEEFEMQLLRERTGAKSKVAKMNQIGTDLPKDQSDDKMASLMKQMEILNKKFDELRKSQEEQTKDHKPKTWDKPNYQPYRNENRRGRGANRGNWRRQTENRGQTQDESRNRGTDKKSESTKETLNL